MLIEIRAQTGKVAPELASLPDIPAETAHLWRWFGDLSRARLAGFSTEAIGWADMHAYFALMRIRAQAWEIEALRQLDDAFLDSRVSDKVGKAGGAKELKGKMTGKAGI